jgi:aminoglycoside phosphotransferase (APT) family kinase protein
MYEQEVGRNLPEMLFYYVFGTFKIAVIAQQIYARFVKGFTQDKRFTRFDRFVEKLGHIAATALDRRSI